MPLKSQFFKICILKRGLGKDLLTREKRIPFVCIGFPSIAKNKIIIMIG